MNFEINISKDGSHFFATNSRSIPSEHELKKVLPVLAEKFPESEGYGVSVCYYQTSGRSIDYKKVLAGMEGEDNAIQN